MLQTCIATRAARLALRPVREGDDEALFPLFTDWDVIRWLSSPPWPYTREDMQSFIREQTATDGEDAETRFAITLEQTPIGILSVRMRPASHLQRGAGPNFGYWIAQRYWGRGYMTEALRSGVDHVFRMGRTRRSIAARSRETMHRCGCRRRSGSFGMARRCCTLGRAAENSRMSTRC